MGTGSVVQHTTPTPKGAVIHWAARYDLLVWLLAMGRERRLRERLIAPAALQSGESILDVGCGTGNLALIAKQRVGDGVVAGIDPSAEMIERAQRKARRQQLDVDFREGYAQSLPFADASFDVVVNTLMLHHLPSAVRSEALREMRRVMRPSGRLLAVDFPGGSRGLIGRLHRHGNVRPDRLRRQVEEAGFSSVDAGEVGMLDLRFVLASL